MAQLDQIRSIIMNMKAQSRAQAQEEAIQTEGSAALAIEPKPVKIAEPIQLIRGGKQESNNTERPNTPNIRGQHQNDDQLHGQEKIARIDDSNRPIEPSKNDAHLPR